MIKGAQKLTFEQYDENTGNKYAQKVVKWVKKNSENETIYKMNMRHCLSMALADLNNDKIEDILAVLRTAGWCGSVPTSGCKVMVFLGPE